MSTTASGAAGSTISLHPRAVELLFSKAFHDLVSPVSAVNNGVELIQESDDMTEEAIALIAHSAQAAARKLQFFRMTYGAAGSEKLVDINTARGIATQFFQGTKVKLEWPQHQLHSHVDYPKGYAKCVLSLILLADDVLSHGGMIEVVPPAGEDMVVGVVATGKNAEIKPAMRAAFDGHLTPDELDARTIHAFATARYAEFFGFELKMVQAAHERLELSIGWVPEPPEPEVLPEMAESEGP